MEIAAVAAALLALFAALFIMYRQGLLVLTMKNALSFIGSWRGDQASFSHCNGFVRRIVRFRESRDYKFVLDSEVSKGEVWAEVLDDEKKIILRLSADAPEAVIRADEYRRYILVIRFRSATGTYHLQWE